MTKEAKQLKVLIAAGGTGGHVFPGLAVAAEVARLRPEAEIFFVGTERGVEATLVPPQGYRLAVMSAHSIKDRKGFGHLVAWASLPVAIVRALKLVHRERPRLVISIGGYVAGPICVAAWILRVPIVIVEPNAIAGMTNRLLGRFARRVCVAFDEARRFFAPGRAIVTGNPIRREVVETRREASGDAQSLTLFVFGGSQGARTLNRAMAQAAGEIAQLEGTVRLLHQAGANDDVEAIRSSYADAGLDAEVFPFCDRIWECYAKADLVIARSGAGTVAEVAALGIPSILVPYPYAADDHQRANALALVRVGGAVLINDTACTGQRLAYEVRHLLSTPNLMEHMRAALAKAGHPDAARCIAEESLKLIS